jgi:hypothetical protein
VSICNFNPNFLTSAILRKYESIAEVVKMLLWIFNTAALPQLPGFSNEVYHFKVNYVTKFKIIKFKCNKFICKNCLYVTKFEIINFVTELFAG